MKSDNQIEFLYNSISDAQDLIKYTESKAAFVIGISTAFVAVLFITFENIIKYFSFWSSFFWLQYIVFILFLSLSIWIIAKIIMPIKKPTQCIMISKEDMPKIEFYLTPNHYNSFLFPFFNSSKHKLKIDFKAYYQNIQELDNNVIIKVLTLELLKISYIRNVKSDRLKVLIYFILITTLFLVFFYIKYQIELTKILNIIAIKN